MTSSQTSSGAVSQVCCLNSISFAIVNIFSWLGLKRNTFSELPGYGMVLVFMDKFGRKPLLGGSFFFTSSACFICTGLGEVGEGFSFKRNYLKKECIHVKAFHRESLALSLPCSGRDLLLQILQLSTCKYSIISHNIMLCYYALIFDIMSVSL